MNDWNSPCSLPPARGEWSELLIAHLTDGTVPTGHPAPPSDPLVDDDLQLALYLAYEPAYRGLVGVADGKEWDLGMLAVRQEMERLFENALRAAVPAPPAVSPAEVPTVLRGLDGPDSELARVIQRRASLGQVREFVIHRSAYHLKEADPHTFALPRIGGAAKAAFAEIQADEYGGGVPDRIHAHLFAEMMTELGLQTRNGAYLATIPGATLAGVNLMSLFGLHRRWRGAAVGHLALFELGSSRPNRRYGDGLRRLGFGAHATRFFDEHVEADAVHAMLATYDLAGRLAADEPALISDIVFGARALAHIEDRSSRHLRSAWDNGRSSLLGAVLVPT